LKTISHQIAQDRVESPGRHDEMVQVPETKGTYILIARVLQLKHLDIGSLGELDIVPRFYAYVGSAFGSGGLRARLGHHLESTAEPHWHIDYLLQVAKQLGRTHGKGSRVSHAHSSVWLIGLS